MMKRIFRTLVIILSALAYLLIYEFLGFEKTVIIAFSNIIGNITVNHILKDSNL